MNIRKNVDYSGMYAAIDDVMEQELSQMEMYCSIGQAVAARSEKGAAVMAAEYITSRYPDARGFSPRNLRRMRDFYRTYENHPSLLSLSMEISWTQNVVIMEADLSMDLREWYLRAVKQFGWSKAELINKIAANAHEKTVLSVEEEVCYVMEQENNQIGPKRNMPLHVMYVTYLSVQRIVKMENSLKEHRRRWRNMVDALSLLSVIRRFVCFKQTYDEVPPEPCVRL